MKDLHLVNKIHLPLKVKIPILFIRYVHGPSKAYTYKFERARNVYFD